MLFKGRTGAICASDGSESAVRLDKPGAMTIVSAHPLYSEACIRGRMFVSSTAVAGVAPGTALSTTPPLILFNPVNSGVDLIVLKTAVGYISGTLGAGSIVYAYVSPQSGVPSSGAELTVVCTKIGKFAGAGRVFQGSTVASTPLILRPAYTMSAFTTTTAVNSTICQDLVEGEFIVPPSTCFVVQGVAAAGSTPLVLMSICWEEVSI